MKTLFVTRESVIEAYNALRTVAKLVNGSEFHNTESRLLAWEKVDKALKTLEAPNAPEWCDCHHQK